MRIRILSDLHLEAVSHPDRFVLPDMEFDVLVAAGDIHRSRPDLAARTVARLAAGRPAVAVLGNHEPFDRRIDEARAEAAGACAAFGVTLLDDGVAEIGGVRFVGGTLWTDGALGGFARDWPDGRTGEGILVGPERRPWTIRDARSAHARTLRLIKRTMGIRDEVPLVVVTHHPPLARCLHPNVVGKPVSGILASDLSHATDSGCARLWIHGHMHHSLDFTCPGGTRVICNPAGDRFSNPRFDDGLTIEVA